MIEVQSTDLLIAPPGIPDPRFRDSVLMLTHNNDAGSFALCVNRSAGFTLDEILEDSDIAVTAAPRLPVFWGGPVSSNSLWMVHSTEWQTKGTVMISSAWAMTSSEEMFHCLSDGDSPRYLRMVMGYCSWAPDQLRHELNGLGPWKREHSWLVAQNLGPEWLLDQPPEDLWAAATTLCSHQAVDSWL
jgi:putative transcriptional regulator